MQDIFSEWLNYLSSNGIGYWLGGLYFIISASWCLYFSKKFNSAPSGARLPFLFIAINFKLASFLYFYYLYHILFFSQPLVFQTPL
ncbi:hypothetical protein AWM75_01680 [Aerococcus urinaehominis]|uniref:Uncharacterized protein n=1 Tax=Aerococcus urinaehominis TaxID=128944 RepID=A0A109RGR1_9LACT|nr:hypothetical protein AWM75_01680 [Aerococcus urinaehominis]SDM12872.1 hypothetical protein SAMN04487985_10624 [Aerococcus urinaehominis]